MKQVALLLDLGIHEVLGLIIFLTISTHKIYL
jgi:hypothetical protein